MFLSEILVQTPGSATILSIATLLGMLPTILLSPFVGPYIDRLNKKMLLIVPDIVAAMVALILSAVGEFGGFFPVWLIFVSLLVRALARTFQMPTIQAILPTMVPGDQLTRERSTRCGEFGEHDYCAGTGSCPFWPDADAAFDFVRCFRCDSRSQLAVVR